MGDEGEFKGSCRGVGEPGEGGKAVAGLRSIVGNLAMYRFQSKHLSVWLERPYTHVVDLLSFYLFFTVTRCVHEYHTYISDPAKMKRSAKRSAKRPK